MDSVYWEQVEALLQMALEKDPRYRASFVRSIPDPRMRAEVASLLAANDNGGELDVARILGNAAALVSESRSELNGANIGRFRVIELLGMGGMGEVYLAEDLELGRKVALKLLHQNFSKDPERVLRFRQEARAASALNHPNILTVFDIGEFGGRTYIATEFVDGTALSRRLEQGAFEPKELISIGQQLASALAGAHEKGILHRDIKPDNIMLRQDGLVKLLDFGLARMSAGSAGEWLSAANTLPGTVLGTPSYMSPEQARGQRIDSRSDLWSLGAVLYEMATGQPAFPGQSAPDVLVAILQNRPPHPSDVKPGLPLLLEELIVRLLETDPACRFSSASEVRHALRIVEEHLDATALQHARDADARPSRIRRRWIIAGALAAAAVVAVLLGRHEFSGRRAPMLRQITTTVAENHVTAAAVSSDGRTLAWTELNGALNLSDVDGDRRRAFALPPGINIDRISYRPDRSVLLLSGRTATQRWTLWSASVADGTLRLLREDARSGVFSPDGMQVAFTSPNQSDIFVIDWPPGAPVRKLMAGGSTDTFPMLFWSAQRRLSFQRRHFAPKPGAMPLHAEVDGHYDRSYGSIDSASGKLLAEESSGWIRSACALNDGRVLFLQSGGGTEAYSWNVWVARTDPDTGRFAERPRRMTDEHNTGMAAISCPADGKFAAVTIELGRSTVSIGDLQHPGFDLVRIRRLTLDQSQQYPQCWTPDGEAVLFEKGAPLNDRPLGQWDIYLQKLNEPIVRPIATTNLTEHEPTVTPDGAWVLYNAYEEQRGRETHKMYRVPLAGGRPEEVPSGPYEEFRCPGPRGKTCILRTIEDRQYIYRELDPVKGRGPELARTALKASNVGDWSLSMDGGKIAYPNHDAQRPAIHIIHLYGDEGPEESEVAVPGLMGMRDARWASGDQGWFSSVRSPTGVKLVYIDLQGNFRVLRESPYVTWGIPSPDGRHIAFVDQEVLSNVWRLEGFK